MGEYTMFYWKIQYYLELHSTKLSCMLYTVLMKIKSRFFFLDIAKLILRLMCKYTNHSDCNHKSWQDCGHCESAYSLHLCHPNQVVFAPQENNQYVIYNESIHVFAFPYNRLDEMVKNWIQWISVLGHFASTCLYTVVYFIIASLVLIIISYELKEYFRELFLFLPLLKSILSGIMYKILCILFNTFAQMYLFKWALIWHQFFSFRKYMYFHLFISIKKVIYFFI